MMLKLFVEPPAKLMMSKWIVIVSSTLLFAACVDAHLQKAMDSSGPLHPYPTRVWSATDTTNSSALTQVIVLQGFAIVGTRGPAIMGKRVDMPSNTPYPPQADWEIALDGKPTALVAISDSSVAVVTNDTVGAYSADGTPLWNWTIGSDFTLVSNGNTPVDIVVDRVRGIAYIGSQPNSDDCVPAPVMAINVSSGALIWQQNSTVGATNNILALKGNALFVPSNNCEINYGLLKLHALTGDIIWNVSFNTTALIVSAPPTTDIVALYSIGGLILFNGSTGDLWHSKGHPVVKEADGQRAPQFNNGTLYYMGGSYITAIDTFTWKNVWDHKMVVGPQVLFVDDVFGAVFGCSAGHLDMVSTKTGKPTYLMGPQDNGDDDTTCRGITRVSERAIVIGWNSIYMLDVPTKTVMMANILWVNQAPVFVPDAFGGIVVVPNNGAVPGWPIEAMRAYAVLPQSRYWVAPTDFLVIHQYLDNVSTQIVYGMDTDRFYAFNIADGSANWTIPGRDGVFYPAVGMPVTKTAICSAFEEGTYCVSRQTGETISQVPFGTGTLTPLRTFQNRYVGVASHVDAVIIDTWVDGGIVVQQVVMGEIQSGSLNHIDKVDESHFSLFLDSGTMYFNAITPGNNQSQPLWMYNISDSSSDEAVFTCPPVAVGENLIVSGDTRGTLYGFDRKTGLLLWHKHKMLNTPCSRVVVHDGNNSTSRSVHPAAPKHRLHDVATLKMYVMTPSAAYRINPLNGNVIWASPIENSEDMTSRVHSYEDLLIVHGQAGIFAFSTSNGNQVWYSVISAVTVQIYKNALVVLVGDGLYIMQARSGLVVGTIDLQFSGGGTFTMTEPATGYDGQQQVGPLLVVADGQPPKINVVYGLSIPPCLFD